MTVDINRVNSCFNLKNEDFWSGRLRLLEDQEGLNKEMGELEPQSRLIFDNGLAAFDAPEHHRRRDSRDGGYVFGITNDHSNYMQRPKRG